MDTPILLLNQNYEPLSVCNPQRAIRMMIKEKVETIDPNGGICHAAHSDFKLPSVLKLNYYVRMRKRDIPMTKRNVIRRDNMVCQYCGKHSVAMTIDHVIPKSLGGTDSWENLVCACSECNSKKGDRTPAQSIMLLKRRPRRPHYFSFAISRLGMVPENWKPYLFME